MVEPSSEVARIEAPFGLQNVLDALKSHIAVVDQEGRITAVNAEWRNFAEANAPLHGGSHRRTGVGTSYLDVCRAATGAARGNGAAAADGIVAVLGGERSLFELDYPCAAPGTPRWFRLRATPLYQGGARHCLVEHIDITDSTMSAKMIAGHGDLLASVASGRPLSEILAQIVDLVEAQLPDALCSILQVDPATKVLRYAAGQHLPADYNRAVDGVPIGPSAGSCGTAAYRKEPVDVADIATDPLWDDFRHLALPHGLRSCLSIPVIASGNVAGIPAGEVLATFAIYHHEPRRTMLNASPRSLGKVGLVAAHLVSVAIERDRAEAALRSSEARLRAVLDNSPAAIFLKDAAGHHVLVNRRFTDLQREPGSCDGKTAEELLTPSAAHQFDVGHRHVTATRQVDQREQEIMLADGRRRTFLSVQFPLLDAAGDVSAVCGIATDVSERVRAEAERDRLWTHSPDPVCIAGLDARVIDINADWTRRFGWTIDDLRGRPVTELVHADDVAATSEAFATLRRGETLRGFEHRLRCRDGQYRWLSWNALPIVDSGRIYGFVRDITEDRALREQLWQSQKLEAIGQLAGGVAHDFNNLLTVIQCNVALMSRAGTVADEDQELLQEVDEACQRATALTRQLLAFSRKAIVEPRTTDLDGAVETAAKMLRRLIGEDIHLEMKLHAGAAVRIDPGQLEQVVMNLALNARDAMPQGGPLRIATTTVTLDGPAHSLPDGIVPGRYAVLSVADEGIGIDSAVLGRIFEPFFTTKGVGRGTGLGLATVYGIVRQADGQVTVESELGRGTQFRVFLPIAATAATDARPDAQPVPRRGNETVLLAEDEPGVRRMASRVLADHGYRVLVAANGADALRASTEYAGCIDLVVTDVVMPELGGRALVEAMRRQRPALRVLYLSGYTDDAVLRQGIEVSRESFLVKPFTPNILAQRVREVLDAAPRADSSR